MATHLHRLYNTIAKEIMGGTVCLYNSKVAGYKADVGEKVYRKYSKFRHLPPS